MCWGNFAFDYVHSDSVSNSRGILCVWDPNLFRKRNATVNDYFVMIRGVWCLTGNDLLIIAVYAPHDCRDKQMLWDYLTYEIGKWKGEVVIMGDFNEVRYKSERFGSVFNVQGANVFSSFITNVDLEEAIHGDDGNVGGHVKSGAKSCWLDIVRETHALKTKDVSLIPMSDRWKWDLESSRDFSVASVRKIIDDKSLSDVDSKTRWIKYVPIKVNVHAWKVKTDSLPTRFNVSRRGIDIDSIMCVICDNGVETSILLFFYCCEIRQIVRKITRWWDVPYVEVESYEDWYNWLVNLRISSMHKQMFECVFYVM
ncbi:RNA-directed DNA polymerase, eukaryota [Tanacetum coccineum]